MVIYEKGGYSILEMNKGYIVVNNNMNESAHTYIENLSTSMWIIDLSIQRKCPYNIPKYLVESLIRINTDENYLFKLNAILHKKQKDHYYNSNKGRR